MSDRQVTGYTAQALLHDLPPYGPQQGFKAQLVHHHGSSSPVEAVDYLRTYAERLAGANNDPVSDATLNAWALDRAAHREAIRVLAAGEVFVHSVYSPGQHLAYELSARPHYAFALTPRLPAARTAPPSSSPGRIFSSG
ncbi:hypothetical protein [Streptomyces sp. NPDC048442]|uniref:hypothetical protein n=1 Tax=Streptomyces sp. NPDC048442 TaxID=3154823 RepID=UPI003423B3CE